MFVSLTLGIIAIRVYAKINATVTGSEIAGRESGESVVTVNPIEEWNSETPGKRPRRCAWLRLAHAFLMLVSWAMIIGAGAAFTSNVRMGAFPYDQSDPTTDSLIGRCFDRNLSDPLAPPWLSGLQCGLGAYCVESSRGAGVNPYCGGA